MSHPQEPQRQPTPTETVNYAKTLRNTAMVVAVACPVLMLLPPRKLDFFTAGLGITTVYSTNYLVRDSTGRSIMQTDEAYTQASDAIRLERQEALLASKERANIAEQVEATKQAKWAQERNQEVQDALDVGKGFGDIIIDQVYEVWNWGKKRDDDDE
jgi:hypothetical protein